jgi:propanol-preferring alcohol dehydrogenase
MRIKVEACAICRTDLHVIDGDLAHPKLPIIPGHEIIGLVNEVGPGVDPRRLGLRVGVGWLGHTCGQCPYCLHGAENLCDHPEFTGYTRDGGFATHAVVDASFAFDLDPGADAAAQAPLLCAGLIGWRSLKKAGDAKRIGFYGFGAAAHILAQICVWQGREVLAFTRPGDQSGQRFAEELGAAWVGGSDERPPLPLDAAIIFAPVGELVPAALRAVRKGGRVVCGCIHMSDIPAMPYAILWEERELVSVANLTRRDAEEFFPLAQAAGVKTVTTSYPLAEANAAVADLRAGRLNGAAVLIP